MLATCCVDLSILDILYICHFFRISIRLVTFINDDNFTDLIYQAHRFGKIFYKNNFIQLLYKWYTYLYFITGCVSSNEYCFTTLKLLNTNNRQGMDISAVRLSTTKNINNAKIIKSFDFFFLFVHYLFPV